MPKKNSPRTAKKPSQARTYADQLKDSPSLVPPKKISKKKTVTKRSKDSTPGSPSLTPGNPNPQHSSESAEHGTPDYIVTAARLTLGKIALDPASSPEFNELIGAKRIFTAKDDGLNRPWKAKTVFVNPPGGMLIDPKEKRKPKYTDSNVLIDEDGKPMKVRVHDANGKPAFKKQRGPSNMRLWWEKAVEEFESGNAKAIIFIAYSLELFQNAQLNMPSSNAPYMYPFCVPNRRIPFDTWHRRKKTRISGKQPTHANAIILLSNNQVVIKDFELAFMDIGVVRGSVL